MTEPWVSVTEVAQHLRVTSDSVYRWIERRGLPAERVGRRWRFRLSEVDAWARAGGVASGEDGSGASAGARTRGGRFHLPLQPIDSEARTLGCRHTNPDICAKHSLANVCAFVRADGVCTSPPASWPRQFRRLLAQEEGA